MKIVINTRHGGFGLSQEAKIRYLKETNLDKISDSEIPRDDPVLIKIVEEMGSAAAGRYAELKVVEVPDDVNWFIEEYDGDEWVAERHRTWR
ncbi:MAG: hypothetical protein RLZZ196_689 [Bacteroidota bacterium]|jgi:hypothetical protein